LPAHTLLVVEKAEKVRKMFRLFFMSALLIGLSGCINTATTKALITPVGAVGIHSFAPERSPDRMPPPDADRVARMAANAQACNSDPACVSHQ
jgi:hypothetical protein